MGLICSGLTDKISYVGSIKIRREICSVLVLCEIPSFRRLLSCLNESSFEVIFIQSHEELNLNKILIN